MCQDLSTKANTTVGDFINDRRGLSLEVICEHYKLFIQNLQLSQQDYETLTLATYRRITHEVGFTRRTAAFILHLARTSNIEGPL